MQASKRKSSYTGLGAFHEFTSVAVRLRGFWSQEFGFHQRVRDTPDREHWGGAEHE